jgi:hypothetical protein
MRLVTACIHTLKTIKHKYFVTQARFWMFFIVELVTTVKKKDSNKFQPVD